MQALKSQTPTVGSAYYFNGFMYRQIRTSTHVFIHTVKGSMFVFSSGYDQGKIEIYEVSKRDGFEKFVGYASGSDFNRLYACFTEITRRAMVRRSRAGALSNAQIVRVWDSQYEDLKGNYVQPQ